MSVKNTPTKILEASLEEVLLSLTSELPLFMEIQSASKEVVSLGNQIAMHSFADSERVNPDLLRWYAEAKMKLTQLMEQITPTGKA